MGEGLRRAFAAARATRPPTFRAAVLAALRAARETAGEHGSAWFTVEPETAAVVGLAGLRVRAERVYHAHPARYGSTLHYHANAAPLDAPPGLAVGGYDRADAFAAYLATNAERLRVLDAEGEA
jgi:hypothetical protein